MIEKLADCLFLAMESLQLDLIIEITQLIVFLERAKRIRESLTTYL